jgi:hypothetical protein
MVMEEVVMVGMAAVAMAASGNGGGKVPEEP